MEALIEFVTKLASKGIKLSANDGQLNCYARKGMLTDEIKGDIAKHKLEIITLLETSETQPSIPTNALLQQQLAYWREKLSNIPTLDLATDYPRQSGESRAMSTHAFTLDAQLTEELTSMAQSQSATLFMILLAAFKALLYRYTGQSDICVGSPIANRRYGEVEDLSGRFVNTLVLRSRISGDDTFAALLSHVKATCLEAYKH